jgi:hypothetical protein
MGNNVDSRKGANENYLATKDTKITKEFIKEDYRQFYSFVIFVSFVVQLLLCALAPLREIFFSGRAGSMPSNSMSRFASFGAALF